MKYAIIAAGEGSRLAQEGITAPKPLVKVGGECLIDRLIRVFMANDAEEIVVICNNLTTLVQEHLDALERDGLDGKKLPLRHIVKTTPSSMHSFFELSKFLMDSPFVLTTVDTIFREKEFTDYISAFQKALSEGVADGMMGVTDYIDDEKPLYVASLPALPRRENADSIMRLKIVNFLDSNPDKKCKYISGGIYGLTPKAIDTLNRCMAEGQSRMRNFQRGLIADGLMLLAYPFSKVMDVDHASDVQKAEEFLSEK